MFQQQQGKKARQVQNSPTTIEPRSIFSSILLTSGTNRENQSGIGYVS